MHDIKRPPKECRPKVLKRIVRYLIHTLNFGIWYPKRSSFDLVGYSNSDYAKDKVDRKSTSGTCQFLGRSLVSWSSKKQNSVSLSTAEAEYIAAGSCCAQLLWMTQTLKDYGINVKHVPLLYTMKVLLRLLTTPCNILELSILKFVIISFEIMLLRVTLILSMFAPKSN